MLQANGVIDETLVGTHSIRCKAQGLFHDLSGFLIATLFGEHHAQTNVRSKFPWVALNLLLKRLGRFIQFSGYILIVVGGDRQLFPLAGMFPQPECLVKYLLARSSSPRAL